MIKMWTENKKKVMQMTLIRKPVLMNEPLVELGQKD